MAADAPVLVARELARRVNRLRFSPPVTHVYNPLRYARASHARYLELYGAARREIVLIGMNPGPWGMSQTGVPFGNVEMVRDWLRILEPVGVPPREHPRRPVLGFDCPRDEVSGRRLWGWARDRFGTPRAFFRRHMVLSYCPLLFLEASGRNRTPDQLPRAEAAPLFEACDEALRRMIDHFRPRRVIGIGRFAERRSREALARSGVEVGFMPHPSPASPRANRGWASEADVALGLKP